MCICCIHIKTVIMGYQNIIRKSLFVIVVILAISCNSNVIEENPDIDATVKAEYDLGWLINHYMIYPKSENNVNRAGVVEVSWIVTKEGMVQDVKAFVRTTNEPAESAIGRRLIKDKEVLTINQPILKNLIYSIELLRFTPALKDGNPVNSKMTTSIEFLLI